MSRDKSTGLYPGLRDRSGTWVITSLPPRRDGNTADSGEPPLAAPASLVEGTIVPPTPDGRQYPIIVELAGRYRQVGLALGVCALTFCAAVATWELCDDPVEAPPPAASVCVPDSGVNC